MFREKEGRKRRQIKDEDKQKGGGRKREAEERWSHREKADRKGGTRRGVRSIVNASVPRPEQAEISSCPMPLTALPWADGEHDAFERVKYSSRNFDSCCVSRQREVRTIILWVEPRSSAKGRHTWGPTTLPKGYKGTDSSKLPNVLVA